LWAGRRANVGGLVRSVVGQVEQAAVDGVNVGSMGLDEHKKQARINLRVGVVTVSDTRSAETDASGRLIQEMLEAAGHQVPYRKIVPDAPVQIVSAIEQHIGELDALILTGGTGIAPRDCTAETVRWLLDKELEGFGELFRMLSYQEIGSAAFLSRAVAGICESRFIAVLPGAPAGCRLAMEKLILPELGHIAFLLAPK
jgi:molybdopterin adenylyltransferase